MTFLKKTLFIVLIIYCVALLGLFVFQERFIFQSVKLKQGYSFQFAKTFKEINLTTADKAQLNGLYFEVKTLKGLFYIFMATKIIWYVGAA